MLLDVLAHNTLCDKLHSIAGQVKRSAAHDQFGPYVRHRLNLLGHEIFCSLSEGRQGVYNYSS